MIYYKRRLRLAMTSPAILTGAISAETNVASS
jgi:hypothetical protein